VRDCGLRGCLVVWGRGKKKLTDGVNLMKVGNFYLDKIQWLDEGE
jgi:hypothetical protein